jgi:hypothetical protein
LAENSELGSWLMAPLPAMPTANRPSGGAGFCAIWITEIITVAIVRPKELGQVDYNLYLVETAIFSSH